MESTVLEYRGIEREASGGDSEANHPDRLVATNCSKSFLVEDSVQDFSVPPNKPLTAGSAFFSSASVFSSDLIRAKDTARILAKHLKADILFESGLRELNNGCAAGLTTTEAKQIENPITQPALDWIPYSGAESWRMMTNRVFKYGSADLDPCSISHLSVNSYGERTIVKLNDTCHLQETEEA